MAELRQRPAARQKGASVTPPLFFFASLRSAGSNGGGAAGGAEGDNGAKDEHKGGSPPTWFFGRSGSAGKLPPSTSSSTASLGSSEGGATGPGLSAGGGMKRSRSYIDMLNDKLKEEPSTDPRVVSSYLKFIVMLDFLAVATVVPLLPQYFARSGCCNEQLAWISSAYSLSQLVGGLLLGWVSDGIFSRKTILMTSLLGSAASYGMVGISTSKSLLILSRIVVGLVKQTMTMATALMSDLPMERARRVKHMSHLTAAVTISWIVGPALGGYLFWISPRLPPLVAAVVFTVAAVLCLVGVPNQPDPRSQFPPPSPLSSGSHSGVGAGAGAGAHTGVPPRPKSLGDFLRTLRNNFHETLNDATTIRIVSIRLLYSFTIISLMPTNFVGYLEARYGLKSHEVAYLHSYRATLSLLAQTFLIAAVVRHPRFTEEATARWAIILGMALKYAEVLNRDRLVFLLGTTPMIVATFSLFDASLQGIYTDSIPSTHRGAALGSMSALQSAVKVAAPLYGGEVFQRVGHEARPQVIFWHYVFLATVVWLVFPPGKLFPKRRVEEKRRLQEQEEAQARLEKEQLERLQEEDARRKAAEEAEREEREREEALMLEQMVVGEEENLLEEEGRDTVPPVLMSRGSKDKGLAGLAFASGPAESRFGLGLGEWGSAGPMLGSGGQEEKVACLSEDEADAPDTGDHLRPHGLGGDEGGLRRRVVGARDGGGEGEEDEALMADHYQQLEVQRREAPAGAQAGGLRPSFPSTDRLHPIRGRFDRGARVKIG